MAVKTKYISTPVLYYLSVIIALALFFQLWRLVLVLQIGVPSDAIPGGTVVQAFLVGLRFDLAVSCYMLVPLVLLGAIPGFDIAERRAVRRLNLLLLVLLAGVAFFIQLADIEFFRFFNYRLNAAAMQWTDTPRFMAGMIWQTYPTVRYLIFYLAILVLFAKTAGFLMRRIVAQPEPAPVVTSVVYLPVLLGILVLGMRGSTEEKAPLTWGAAYFSEYDFANQLALNPNFTFFRDAVYDANSIERVSQMMGEIDVPHVTETVSGLIGVTPDPANPESLPFRRVTFAANDADPPSVILIIGESFGASLIGALDRRPPYDLSPAFDSLVHRGLLFTNFYSNGIHTYTGLLSSLYGLPVVPGTSVMKRVVRRAQFHGLPSILKDHGYRTLFFVTHDPHFDNMQGFLKAHGVDRMVSVFDYDPDEKLSTLGVPDHVMFDRSLTELKALGADRFFAILLTASHHGPWIVPDVGLDPLPEDTERPRQFAAFRYADWALGRFVGAVMNDPAFANTVIVVTSDNGALYEPTIQLDLTQFHIPLFIHDPRRPDLRGVRSDRLGSQIDILPTVMGLVGRDYDDYSFGADLLTPGSRPTDFVQMAEGFGVGYLQEDRYLVWRPDGPVVLYDVDQRRTTGAAADSLLTSDYLQRALAILKSAHAVAEGTQTRIGQAVRRRISPDSLLTANGG